MEIAADVWLGIITPEIEVCVAEEGVPILDGGDDAVDEEQIGGVVVRRGDVVFGDAERLALDAPWGELRDAAARRAGDVG